MTEPSFVQLSKPGNSIRLCAFLSARAMSSAVRTCRMNVMRPKVPSVPSVRGSLGLIGRGPLMCVAEDEDSA